MENAGDEFDVEVFVILKEDRRQLGVLMKSGGVFTGQDVLNVLMDICFRYEHEPEKLIDDSMIMSDTVN